MRRFVSLGPAVLALIAVFTTLWAAPNAVKAVQLAQIGAAAEIAQVRLDRSSLLEQINSEVRSIADSVLPSVVHIEVRREGQRRWSSGASGAGWFWDDQGHIVTNAHVVRNTQEVRVELYDGRVREADVIGIDNATDIAVIRVDPRPGVFPARRATGEPVFMGDRVYAFGSPFSIKFSMSEGIVSGLGRGDAAVLIGLSRGYTNFIQTDAAMNPGNSGGPLMNVNGRVIGMNAAIANNADSDNGSPAGQSAGIGFSIPLETIENVVPQLMGDTASVVIRGYLGVSLDAELDRAEAERRGFIGEGVLITRVVSGQPASKAGLETGDIITSIAGTETPTRSVLRAVVSIQTPGEPIAVTFWRDGRERESTMRLGAAIAAFGGLDYIAGSEEMTKDEVRDIIRERQRRTESD
ncbi:MAG: trypsin-like peptidase domain-containing protein [Planctomycetota bacterium]